jgi:hypothetical protein
MAVNFGSRYIEGQLWMVILCAQALPYLSAVTGALVAHYSHDQPVEAPQALPATTHAEPAPAEPVEARTIAT